MAELRTELNKLPIGLARLGMPQRALSLTPSYRLRFSLSRRAGYICVGYSWLFVQCKPALAPQPRILRTQIQTPWGELDSLVRKSK